MLNARGHILAALLVLLIGLLATSLATVQIGRAIRARQRSEFQSAIQRWQAQISTGVESHVALLRGAAGLFAGSTEVTRADFHDYNERLLLGRNYPGILGIGFTRRIAPDQLGLWQQRMRQSGVENFQVWPTHPRDEYFSILYLEPLDRRNQAAIGYDMFTEPVRRAAMQRACDRGDAAASGRVTLVQEIDQAKQAGFLIYVPIYDFDGIPSTVEARREKLLGFVYSPLRADDLLNQVVRDEQRAELDVEIYDGRGIRAESLLHQSGDALNDENGPRQAAVATMDVAGRTWTLRAAPRAEFLAAAGQALTPIVPVSGILLSILAAGVVWTQSRARDAAERAAVQLRLARDQAEQAREQAERFARAKDEFLASVSHELRTPLTPVLLTTSLLQARRDLSQEVQHDIETIRRNVELEARLIDDLLDLTRITHGKLQLDIQNADVHRLLKIAFEISCRTDSLQFELRLDATRHQVRADPARLQQVFWNLLNNACKFTPAGGTVTVSTFDLHSDQIRIEISDTGIGIDPEALPLIFKAFEQGDTATTRRFGGLGLGLAISRTLVEMHGGQIGALSDGKNRGATFFVELPVNAQPTSRASKPANQVEVAL